LNPNIFPDCKPSGYIVGKVSAKISEELYLGKNCYAVTGGHDGLCCSLGSGIINEGKTFNIIGTAEALIPIINKPLLRLGLMKGNISIEPYVLDNLYAVIAPNYSSGLLLKWLKNNFLKELDILSKKEKINVYKIIDSEASDFPSNLFVVPHILGAGVPYTNSEAKGIFYGFDVNTTRKDILRAFLEGPIYEDLVIKNYLKKQNIFIDDIISSGGGSDSDKWLQMRADILGNRIIKTNIKESGCFGAAMLAGAATNIWASIEEIVKKKIKIQKYFDPDLDKNQKYEELFKIYKKLYFANRSFGKELAALVDRSYAI